MAARLFLRLLLAATLLVAACASAQRAPEVRYEPTPYDVVQAMLELAAPRAGELVADLGCGDGRIVIEAVLRHGARGLCVDIDPRRIAEARRNAEQAGAAARITFLQQDLFSVDLREVNVLMLFLSPNFNLKLRPRIERELARGARVVSHWHDMGDWQADQSVQMRSDGRLRPIYLWIIR
jgi:predicted RNA methylase